MPRDHFMISYISETHLPGIKINYRHYSILVFYIVVVKRLQKYNLISLSVKNVLN